jgi:RHS repeat-associated protein
MTTAAICAFGGVWRSPSYYRGEQYDSDLGLYYLRARYYNPATGRFLSRDPQAADKASKNHPSAAEAILIFQDLWHG